MGVPQGWQDTAMTTIQVTWTQLNLARKLTRQNTCLKPQCSTDLTMTGVRPPKFLDGNGPTGTTPEPSWILEPWRVRQVPNYFPIRPHEIVPGGHTGTVFFLVFKILKVFEHFKVFLIFFVQKTSKSLKCLQNLKVVSVFPSKVLKVFQKPTKNCKKKHCTGILLCHFCQLFENPLRGDYVLWRNERFTMIQCLT